VTPATVSVERSRWERIRTRLGWPIVVRDLRSAQRNPRIAATTLGAVALLSMAICIGVLAVVEGGAADPEQIGQILAQMVYWAGAVVVCGAFPGMASVPLVAERERRSLDLVMVSQLSPTAIAVGTVAAGLTNGFLMLAALMPPLVLALVFGGVPAWMVAEMVWVVAVTGFLAACIGVHASATSKTTVRAVLQGYIGTLALPGALCFIAGVMFFAALEGMQRGYFGPSEVQGTVLGIGIGTVLCVALALLSVLLARNALLPPGGNRATLLRIYVVCVLGLLMLMGAWLMWELHSRFGPTGFDHENWRGFGTAVVWSVWFAALVATLAASTEDPPGRRVERKARDCAGVWAWMRAFYPGAHRGAWFMVICAGLWLVLPALGLDLYEAGATWKRGVRSYYRPAGVLTLQAIGLWAQLVALAGAGLWLRRKLGSALRARMALSGGFFLLQVLAGIGVGWTVARTGKVQLGLINGSLFSNYTLGHGAWAAAGKLDSQLDPEIGGVFLPFPILFAAVHLLLGLLLLGWAWWSRDPLTPAQPLPAPPDAPADG